MHSDNEEGSGLSSLISGGLGDMVSSRAFCQFRCHWPVVLIVFVGQFILDCARVVLRKQNKLPGSSFTEQADFAKNVIDVLIIIC